MKPRVDYWDVNDESQLKGLISLGEKSLAWRKAPLEMQEAAREYSAKGWKAPVFEMPDIEAAERLAIQQEGVDIWP